MKRVIYSEQAITDLGGIFDYVAQHNPGAAERLALGILDTCDLIAANPEIGTRRDSLSPGLRLFSHRGYAIYYRITDEAVRITRFLHHARDVEQQSFD